jgi:hypothetical protein
MDALQFSLFFVALLIGYVLVHLRLLRFEEHMQKLAGLRSIDDRLRGLDDRLRLLGEGFEKVRLDRVEAHLDRLHDDLEDLREATADVQQAVVQIPAPQAPVVLREDPVAPVAASSEAPGERVRAMVETRLLQLGYHDLQILTDLSALRAEHDIDVQVECERGGMPRKGRVLVRNGRVRDVALQSIVQMFP